MLVFTHLPTTVALKREGTSNLLKSVKRWVAHRRIFLLKLLKNRLFFQLFEALGKMKCKILGFLLSIKLSHVVLPLYCIHLTTYSLKGSWTGFLNFIILLS